MSTYVSPVDPPDLGLLPTFRTPAPTLARAVEARRVRALLLARLHADLDRDPDSHLAGDRQRDRPPQRGSVAALSRSHRRSRPASLRHQLQPPLRDGPDRHPDRGADARAPLPGVSPLPARLLRPARDRTGALAGDERPLPDPLLHRLGPRAGDAERDDDHRGRHRPRARRSTAHPLRGRVAAADRVRRLPLRAARLAHLPPRCRRERAT